MLENIKWIFFDIGSTLIDETECYKDRISKTLKQKGAPTKEEFLRLMDKYANQNEEPYKKILKEFGLLKVKWNGDKEKIYPDVVQSLEILSKKYKLGIIANQPVGYEEKLKKFDILKYIDVTIISGDVGIKKPDIAIFELALKKAGCKPEEAVMIGDRLDNDIIPAQQVNMKTVWIKQGYGGKGNSSILKYPVEAEVTSIKNIVEIFKI